MSISEIIFEHEGNIQALNNREKSALKRNFSTKSTEDLTELAIASNLNKLLQRRSMFGYTSDNISKVENRAQFDIEKIISDLNLNKEKRVAVIAKEL